MRLYPRRASCLFCCAIVFLGLGVYIYTKTAFFSGKKKHIRNFSLKNIISYGKGRDIFWTKESGVKRFHHEIGSDTAYHKSNSSLNSENEKNAKIEDANEEELHQSIHFNMNVQASDLIPLNRVIPDSRPKGCDALNYPAELPSTSVVIPFHNEWPSVLMRTVHSLINRTPKYLLKKIILVDDASDLKSLKTRLSNYVKWTFPEDLVTIVRLSQRHGLIRARLEGFKEVTSETVSFFDSHMEVNRDWLQPLLHEIKKNRKTVAMTQLDYIDNTNFKYNFYEHYRTRYGFKWDMEFFETFFRPDQLEGKSEVDPVKGVLMVGPGFVVDSNYFRELGTYDSAMKIWGGENIEFAWRTWMCGGQMVHVPCSRVGHIERSQPYSFPEGRRETEMFNYKRAVEVWLGPYKEYVYDAIPGIRDVNVGNLTERLKIKERLKCKDFKWFLDHVWPELLTYKEAGKHWGQIKSSVSNNCLDNDGYLFQDPSPLVLKSCSSDIQRQAFALTPEGQLRTTLHCVVADSDGVDLMPVVENCLLHGAAKWSYQKSQHLVHEDSQQCLQVMTGGKLVLQPCQSDLDGQKWKFQQKFWSA